MYCPNKYLNFSELKSLLSYLHEKYSEKCDLETLAKTEEGREIFLLTIYDKSKKPHNERPALWIDGGTHAMELATTQAAVHTAHLLLENPNSSKKVDFILSNYTVYILPRISPDGTEHVLKSGRYIRSSPKGYPDVPFPSGFHEKDLDGDNEALTMRIKDPNGRWKISTQNPNLMVPRGLNDFEDDQDYYNLLNEGLVENYDGHKITEGNQHGLDFNRNFPADWRGDAQTAGAGMFPLDQIETRTVVEAIVERKNIFTLQSFHTFSGVTLRPFANLPDSEMDPHDLFVYKKLGDISKQITNYDCVSINHDFKYHPNIKMTGSFLEWAYSDRGIFTFCTELWNIKDVVGLEKKDYLKDAFHGYSESDQQAIWKFLDQKSIIKKYFKEWTKFNHPQFGEVEIGGWRFLKIFTNPPTEFLEEVVEKNANSTIELALSLPILNIKETKVEAINEDLHRLDIIVENKGALPTYGSQVSLKNKVGNQPFVVFESETLKIVNSPQKREIPHLEGRTQNYIISNNMFNVIDANSNEVKLSWVLQGKGLGDIYMKFGKAGSMTYRILI
ncbi:MAG: M14 family metallopeptidase [Bacteriovoracaceae bacterium]